MIRCQRALGWAALAFCLLFAHEASSAGKKKDALAEKALRQALEEDYLETRFDEAEQRIRKAIQACGKDACATTLVAKLHAALGSVLAGGKKELEDARDEFVEALNLDPKITPDPNINSAEVTFAFENAQKKLKIIPTGKPPDTGADKKPPPPSGDAGKGGNSKGGAGGASPQETPPDTLPGDKTPPPPPPPEKPVRRNWITLSFAPDLSVISGTDVCHPTVRQDEHFICLRQPVTPTASPTRYLGTPVLGNADNINTGVAPATLRLMLGYDRVLGDNFTLGARFGFIFNGASGPKVSFLPFHAEGRFGFWPRSKPFADSSVVRPFLMVSGGLGQVDTKVNVQVLEDGFACRAVAPENSKSDCTHTSPNDTMIEPRTQTLTVYKQAGTGFAGLSAGVQFAPIPNFGINVAVRGNVTFPVVTAVFSPELGVGLGF